MQQDGIYAERRHDILQVSTRGRPAGRPFSRPTCARTATLQMQLVTSITGVLVLDCCSATRGEEGKKAQGKSVMQ